MEEASCLQTRITQTAAVTAMRLPSLQLAVEISLDTSVYATRRQENSTRAEQWVKYLLLT